MSSLPNETFSVITNFLPNDDITDLMFLSRTFNALATPRLRKIDEEMSTMDQSIESFMPSLPSDHEWISQLNLKRFEPIGTMAKKRMKEVFENLEDLRDCLRNIHEPNVRSTILPIIKEGMSLERFDDPTFLRILGALIATPKFRQKYNILQELTFWIDICFIRLAMYNNIYPHVSFYDVGRILTFYNQNNL